MCILFLSLLSHPRYSLVLASNRDEHKLRPTERAHFWSDVPHIYAGRDKLHNGTWLGVSTHGRLAVLTNLWDIESHDDSSVHTSRGVLVSKVLESESLDESKEWLCKNGQKFNGFNLLFGNLNPQQPVIFYYNNHTKNSNLPLQLSNGIYGLSNAELDTPWGKLTYGKTKFVDVLNDSLENQDEDDFINKLIQLLRDDSRQTPHNAQKNGTNSVFVPDMSTPEGAYGTRTNTIVLLTHDGRLRHVELTFEGDETISQKQLPVPGSWHRTEVVVKLAQGKK